MTNLEIWHGLNDSSLDVRSFGHDVEALEVRLYADNDGADGTECDLLVHEFSIYDDPCIYEHCHPYSPNVREVNPRMADPVEGIGIRYKDGTTESYLSDVR